MPASFSLSWSARNGFLTNPRAPSWTASMTLAWLPSVLIMSTGSRLEGATFTVEDFLGLEDGDLLTFDHPLERSLDCIVNGKQKFKGQVVRLGNKKAFRIA